ncbi:hypothetical protein Hanom_Chr07g00668791 [Helianthus anomalus]
MELTSRMKMARFQTFWIQMRKIKPLDESCKTGQTSWTKNENGILLFILLIYYHIIDFQFCFNLHNLIVGSWVGPSNAKVFWRPCEAVLEKQSYMLIGRHDVENLMRRDPASAFLPTSLAHANADNHIADAENDGVELQISELLMKLRPIKQVLFYFSLNVFRFCFYGA